MHECRTDTQGTRGRSHAQMRRAGDCVGVQSSAWTAEAPTSGANANEASLDPLRDASLFKLSLMQSTA